ncbi:MAG: hypothetical protein JSV90_08220 [Methanobacteriota archaeon]|nr:MAG: hypothetical protein JSV90_08220 [Euryarchaeota archaeon]
MFGKKLVVGYLVDRDRRLLKEFLFSPKADVTYDDILKATEGKGDLAALGAFEVDKYVGNIVAGKEILFIIVSRDVAEDDETEFFKYMLTSAESRFSQSLDERISAARAAEERLKAEQKELSEASAKMSEERAELEKEIEELGRLETELENLRTETSKWQEELKEFETKVNDRHAQINDRVTLLLEREQALVRNQKAFDAAMEAKRGLMRSMQAHVARGVTAYEEAFGKLAAERADIASRRAKLGEDVSQFTSQKEEWDEKVKEAKARLDGIERDRKELDALRTELTSREKSLSDFKAQLDERERNVQAAIKNIESERGNLAGERLKLDADLREKERLLDEREAATKSHEERAAEGLKEHSA